MSKVQITRPAAVALFTALGIKAAEKWNGKRMAAKLSKIDEMIDDDVKLEKAENTTLKAALKAIEDEAEIEIVGAEAVTGTPAPTPAPKKGKVAKDAAPEDEEEVVDEEAEAFEALKNRYDAGELTAKQFAKERKDLVKQFAKPAAKATKPEKAPKPAVKTPKPEKAPSTTPGVRKNTNARPYLAGQVLAKYGFDVGITGEMVAELNGLYGKENDAESFGRLRSAWHAVQGYLENTK